MNKLNVFISGFAGEVKDSFKILKFDVHTMTIVSERKSATMYGGLFLGVPVVLNLILVSLNFPQGLGAMFSRFLFWPMIIPPLSLLGCMFVIGFLAKKSFSGAGNTEGVFRILSYCSAVAWFSIPVFVIAFLNILDPFKVLNMIWLVMLVWLFVVAYNMLIGYQKLKKEDAIVAMLVGIIAYLILQWFFGNVFMGGMYRFI
ncbi:YIP1 family protein [Candidatus Peregrinibacteria bacterium]|nr:YIP1 family protein [Candidatus Peregrinibacteria bacterium]